MTRTLRSLTLVLLAMLALDCAGSPVARDPHSFSRPDEVVVRHLGLDLDVDFDARRLYGTATLTIENLTGADALWLDTRDLSVSAVDLGSDDAPTLFRFVETRPYLGQ